jgi:hypothetical protein
VNLPPNAKRDDVPSHCHLAQIGRSRTSRWVTLVSALSRLCGSLYLVNRRLPVDFRQFLIRHAELLRFLRQLRL